MALPRIPGLFPLASDGYVPQTFPAGRAGSKLPGDDRNDDGMNGMEQWDAALNLVDDKIQTFRHAPFEHLAKRPYRSELPESSDEVRYTLFVDPVSDSRIRVILQAQGYGRNNRGKAFAHGFDMHKNGSLSEIPADVLWEFC